MSMDNKSTILIVEDGMLYQQQLVNTLQGQYTLHLASSGESALDILNDSLPQLILLDIVLPDINGFDLLTILKSTERTQSIPVIIITGLGNDKDEEKGLLLGAVDYIKKPFNQTIVRARVRTQMQIMHHIQTIEELGFLDALTELANRRKFDYQIEYEWSRAIRKQTPISLLFLDLDHFKQYNDTYGHSQGDIILQTVASIMKSTLKRSTDIPCRWGGEEFAVLLPETKKAEAVQIAENLRANIEKASVLCLGDGSMTHITVSIGLATTIPQKHQLLSAFVEKTDHFLYQAKKCGRNQLSFSPHELD